MIIGAKRIIDIVDKYHNNDPEGKPGWLEDMREIKDIASQWLDYQKGVSDSGLPMTMGMSHEQKFRWHYDSYNGLAVSVQIQYRNNRQAFYQLNEDDTSFKPVRPDETFLLHIPNEEADELALFLSDQQLVKKGDKRVPEGYISEEIYMKHSKDQYDIIRGLMDLLKKEKKEEDE